MCRTMHKRRRVSPRHPRRQRPNLVQPDKNVHEIAQTSMMICASSIHVLYFLWHAANFCSTWMTSCAHQKKQEGQSFDTGIFVGGWRLSVQKRKVKKANFIIFPLCFLTAYKMTSRPSVLAGTWDSKNPDPYYYYVGSLPASFLFIPYFKARKRKLIKMAQIFKFVSVYVQSRHLKTRQRNIRNILKADIVRYTSTFT